MSVLRKLIQFIRGEWKVFLEAARSAEFRELLLWCIPALIVGAAARMALEVHFPYGYFQGDSPDFLVTAERFVRNHALVIHGKKAFLAPICFTFPFLLHIPALIVIPVVQHLAGLAATVLAGGIVRCWFRLWRWFIVPVTVLYTINPGLLWYEHALLAESHYLFCATALALAGTLLVRRPGTRRFAWLIVALFFTAGSRPEGKLFVAFGLGVVAVAYLGGDWKLWARRMAVMAVCGAGIWMSSRSNQAGVLLYATVLPLAPEASAAAPGVEPFIKPLREEEAAKDQLVRVRLNHVERLANEALSGYLKSLGRKGDDAHINALAQKLAMEAIRRKPGLLPVIAANKFLVTCRPDMSGHYLGTSVGYEPAMIYDRQLKSLGKGNILKHLMKGLTGQDIRGKDQTEAFLHAHYRLLEPDWFTPLQDFWERLTLGLQWASHGADKRFVPTWPAFWLVAAAGMAAALIPGRDRLWRFHMPWVAALVGVWFAVMLTGVVNPRYRFVFEPFCILYAALLLDLLWSAAAALFNLTRTRTTGAKCP